MNVLAFSDIHLDAVTAGKSRRLEVVSFLDSVARFVADRKTELIIFSGDAYNPGSLMESMYCADFLRRMLSLAKGDHEPLVVAVAGNHDVVDTSELFLSEPLTTLTPLHSAAVHALDFENPGRLVVFNRPKVVVCDKQGFAVLGLPYLSRAHAKSRAKWMEMAFESALQAKKSGLKLIVVSHLVIPGARMGSESYELARGADQLFPFAEVARLRPTLVLNGHYHMRQIIEADGFEIIIPGSPLRFTFAETEDVSKGLTLVEI